MDSIEKRGLIVSMLSVLIACSLVFAAYAPVQAQGVRGIVRDASSGEVLIGATLYSPLTGRGYTTNGYGFFSVNARDTLRLEVSYMGYKHKIVSLASSDSIVLIELHPGLEEIEGVVIQAERSRTPTHGQHTIRRVDLLTTPTLMAERDVLKTIQLLPGIQRNSEGTSNFSVRGGSHDQNLMLIDGIPVYNVNHLWGFVSVFNPEAVNNVNFYKGGIPASYGGRLSSVVDVMLREGNYDRYTGNVSIGMISTKFTFEGPIQKGRSSFLVAGRRTMYDLIVSPIVYALDDIMPGYYFQDYTVKLNHRVNSSNTVYLSSYMGNDKVYMMARDEDRYTDIEYKDRYDLGWGNITTAFRWNNSAIPNLFSNVTLAYTQFKHFVSNERTETHPDPSDNILDYMGYYSGINDLIARWSLSYYGFNNHQLNAGVEHFWHAFNPGITQETYAGDSIYDTNTQRGDRILGRELNAYIDDRFRYGRLSGNIGIRYSHFSVDGKDYHGIQPRAMLEGEVSKDFSLFVGYNRMFQYLHLVSNSNLGMPTDLWLPISRDMPPQRADQISAGTTYRFNAGYQITIEAYQKWMENLTDYRDGIFFGGSGTNWSRVLTLGSGGSKGVELMVEKNIGDLTGWVTYTLSVADRLFDEINTGAPYPFEYDRRHAANLFLSYKLSPTKSFSLSWVASSGRWITINHDNYQVGEAEFYNLSQRNNFRLPPHHHLDISYTSSKEKKRGTRNWIIGVYNVYANHNSFMIVRWKPYSNEYDPRNLASISIFPIIPFVAWEYVFK